MKLAFLTLIVNYSYAEADYADRRLDLYWKEVYACDKMSNNSN